MKYYTADLHLGHKNIIEYENRPFNSVEEMNESIISNWNAKVQPGDEVYILGDFSFYDSYETKNILQRLNGQKFLIKGNHDSFLKDKTKNLVATSFLWIKDYARIKDGDKDVVLFHYPIAVWDKQHHGSIHLYGHVHSIAHNQQQGTPDLSLFKNAFNVGVDVRDFTPVSLQELLEEKV